ALAKPFMNHPPCRRRSAEGEAKSESKPSRKGIAMHHEIKVADMNPQEVWKRDESSTNDTWHLTFNGRARGYVSKYGLEYGYGPADRGYNWQAIRDDERISGSAPDAETAIARTEEILALPVEEFNRRVAKNLVDEFRQIEQRILRLAPETDLLPGYQAAYEAAVADIRRKIVTAIGLDDSTT
ncbi:MAG: hypothetical protein U1A72_23975, partial [Sulfuritalea sp.]|nr:hypothetical protein [Sulfuritalea sp.]